MAVAAMEHRLLQVFTKDEAVEDVILVGTLKVVPKGHEELHVRFAIHALVDAASHKAGNPKLKHVKVFQVSQPCCNIIV